MGKIGSSFKIVGVMNGTTLNAYLRVEKCPLVQRYTKGSSVCVPDFNSMNEDLKPVLIPIVKDSMGHFKSIMPGSIKWRYNEGEPLVFDEVSGLCTSPGFEGVFKQIQNYEYDYTKDERRTSIALRIMKNLYNPLGNIDNDRIYCRFSVETDGHRIEVEEIYREFIIEETTGNSWAVNIRNADINENMESVTLVPEVYYNGERKDSLDGLNFKWYKEGLDGFALIGSASSQVIQKDDVKGRLKVKCELHVDGSIFSSTAMVEDYNDPRYCYFEKTGMVGDFLYPGNTAVITPVAHLRSSGTVDATYNMWKFSVYGNSGNPIKGKDGFEGSKISFTHDEVMNADGGISGYVESLKE